MAVLNKILNILILVLAVVAVAFGFLLFQKRAELKDRGDQMAKVIHSVAATLDEGSETDVASKLQTKKSAPSNVSLYHDNFKNLGRVLGAFKTQATDVIAQRDALSKTLYRVASTMKLPNADSFAAIEFQNMGKYNKKDTDLLNLLSKVEKRDSDIAAKLVSIASQVDCAIDPNSLKSLDGYSASLTNFSGKIKALKDKANAMASHIKSVCSTWNVSEPSLDGDDYADALTTVASSLKSKKDEFDQTKTELSNKKEQITDINDKLTQKEEIIKSDKEKISALTKRLAQYEGSGDNTNNTASNQRKTGELDLVKMLKGKVLRVNKKWGFVMIDLGTDNKMIIGTKKKVEKSVPLPEGQIMDVARNDKLVAQVKIVKVNNDCSIADLLPDSMGASIQPGDKVFFARKIEAPKKTDDENADEAAADDDTDNATSDGSGDDGQDNADDSNDDNASDDDALTE